MLTRRTATPSTLGAAVVVGGCLCALLASCGNGDGDGEDAVFSPANSAHSPASDSPAAPGAELSSPQPRTSSESGPLPGSQPLDVLPADGTRLDVVDVRAGTHGNFDRVVIELDGRGSPGWFVADDDSPTADGSGRPIDYDGETALVIDVRGLVLPGNGGADGPPVTNAANTLVNSVDVEGIFEGQQRIVVGLDEADLSFNVNLLDSPTRLVVDIMHPVSDPE